MASIRTAGLTKDFGELRAVNEIDLDLPEGGVAGFVGPNGAGKSTTIRMLLGLITPSGGDGEVLGHPIDRPAAYLHRVGALVEAPPFYPTLTGEANLLVFARLGGHDRGRIRGLLEVVGLRERGGDRYKNYSLGMKQRLAIALALLPDPDLLILDEPTNGLDPQGIVEIRSLLMQLGARGKTVSVSSHLLAEIQAACDSIVMIDRSRRCGPQRVDGRPARPELAHHPCRSRQRHRYGPPHRARGCCRLPIDTGNGAIEIVAPARWTADLNRLAWQAGITLGELQATSADLEQAFFAMTGDTRKGTS